MTRFHGPMKSIILAVSLAAAAACGPIEEADVSERIANTGDTSWQDTTLVNRYLGESQAVRINARTNYITYYENGRPISKWKVATARPGKATPKGLFRVHTKDVCPPWDNGEGLSAAGCASNNPLGNKALWFHDGFWYGMHGVDQAHISSVTAADPRERDKSSGCVRNHPSNIEWLFAKAQVGMAVVSGLWDTDPAVTDCSGNGAACGGTSSPGGSVNTRLPRSLPAWCAMNVSEGGHARVRAEANTTSSIVAELKRDAKVRVERKVSGQTVSGSTDWYYVTFTLGGAKEGYLHSSLLDCSR